MRRGLTGALAALLFLVQDGCSENRARHSDRVDGRAAPIYRRLLAAEKSRMAVRLHRAEGSHVRQYAPSAGSTCCTRSGARATFTISLSRDRSLDRDLVAAP